MPAPLPVETDTELRYAVALSCELSRKRRRSLYDAWFAARAIALEIRPELDELEAGRRAMMIIAWIMVRQDGDAYPSGEPRRLAG